MSDLTRPTFLESRESRVLIKYKRRVDVIVPKSFHPFTLSLFLQLERPRPVGVASCWSASTRENRPQNSAAYPIGRKKHTFGVSTVLLSNYGPSLRASPVLTILGEGKLDTTRPAVSPALCLLSAKCIVWIHFLKNTEIKYSLRWCSYLTCIDGPKHLFCFSQNSFLRSNNMSCVNFFSRTSLTSPLPFIIPF